MGSLFDFENWAYNQHDVECNQKYDVGIPYSYHLKAVVETTKRFKHYLDCYDDYLNTRSIAAGHDLIEDARVSYNDIVKQSNSVIAEGIFCLTDSRGRNRSERHSDEYWDLLRENDLAVFVKICDVFSNVSHGIMTNSPQRLMYRKEFPNFKKQLYREKFKGMFDELEQLLNF